MAVRVPTAACLVRKYPKYPLDQSVRYKPYRCKSPKYGVIKMSPVSHDEERYIFEHTEKHKTEQLALGGCDEVILPDDTKWNPDLHVTRDDLNNYQLCTYKVVYGIRVTYTDLVQAAEDPEDPVKILTKKFEDTLEIYCIPGGEEYIVGVCARSTHHRTILDPMYDGMPVLCQMYSQETDLVHKIAKWVNKWFGNGYMCKWYQIVASLN